MWALLRHLLAEPGVQRVVAETMVEHTASRRVMEKAGMRYCGQRAGIEDGESVDLVVYEAVTGSAHWEFRAHPVTPAAHDRQGLPSGTVRLAEITCTPHTAR